MMRTVLLLLFVLGGCGFAPERGTGDILVIGDSILAWNRSDGASIPDVVERQSGRDVVNGAVPGAGFLTTGTRAALGFSVPRQFRPGPWQAVILNGGANDLRNLCGCNQCDAVMDRLITPDGQTGAYPVLLASIEEPVVIVGYYGSIRGGGGAFAGCDDDLQELARRLTRMAARDARITFVPTRALINGNPAFYDTDRVHPSPAGSARIGQRVATALPR